MYVTFATAANVIIVTTGNNLRSGEPSHIVLNSMLETWTRFYQMPE